MRWTNPRRMYACEMPMTNTEKGEAVAPREATVQLAQKRRRRLQEPPVLPPLGRSSHQLQQSQKEGREQLATMNPAGQWLKLGTTTTT